MGNIMKQKLKEFEERKKPITPTSAIIGEDLNQEKENEEKERNEKETTQNKNEEQPVINNLSDLFQDKPRMEDTHTRRTFLIRNDLLERLDDTSNKPDNFTKTKFINYVLENGLIELENSFK